MHFCSHRRSPAAIMFLFADLCCCRLLLRPVENLGIRRRIELHAADNDRSCRLAVQADLLVEWQRHSIGRLPVRELDYLSSRSGRPVALELRAEYMSSLRINEPAKLVAATVDVEHRGFHITNLFLTLRCE